MKHKWTDRHIPGEMSYTYCRACGFMQNPKNKDKDCKGNPGIRPFAKKNPEYFGKTTDE